MTQLVITAVGPDRPGLVGQLTGHLHAAGGNLLDSRMVNLRGQFALMILAEAPEAAASTLSRELPGLGESMGLRLSIVPQPSSGSAVTGMRYRLKTYSLDQPGIVARLTQALHKHGVNIEELSAKQESASFAGTPLFLTEMRLTVPGNVPVRQLRGELETVCNALNCDIDLEPDEA